MAEQLLDGFRFIDWHDVDGEPDDRSTDAKTYRRIVEWAARARGRNPSAFDALTEWILDDSQWTAEQLAANERILMEGVIARFREQNDGLRERLRALEPSGIVNPPVFHALDRFDEALSGSPGEISVREAASRLSVDLSITRELVSRVFADFTTMLERDVRVRIAGGKTGPAGTDSVDFSGYVNYLKECDASVQWALFMPDLVQRQQDGFTVASFEYRTLPAVRFLGQETDDPEDAEARGRVFRTLDAMEQHASGFDHDLFLAHHYGLGVDVGPWHRVWGRFMKAGAPVPDGFVALDFAPDCGDDAGLPYCSQFALATFAGDDEAIHRREGYDVDAMYDITRNIVLSQDVTIPYPHKYWTAEVFLDGADRPSSAYLFSTIR